MRIKLVKPMIHSGGTSATVLFKGYRAADMCARKLIQALSDIELNKRDYHLLPEGEWNRAVDEFNRLQHLAEAIQDALAGVAMHCYEEGIGKHDDRFLSEQEVIEMLR